MKMSWCIQVTLKSVRNGYYKKISLNRMKMVRNDDIGRATSSSESGPRSAFWSSSGTWSASPFPSKRSVGGRYSLQHYGIKMATLKFI